MSAGDTAIAVRDIGSFHIGGRMIRLDGLPMRDRISTPGGPVHRIDPNGEIILGQMYVHYVHLLMPQAPSPILLWHGGGMTGVNWESTPDGRPGWQMFFLRAGFDTYVSDAVERGRASWAPYPQAYTEAPYFRTAQEAWEEVFRFGPQGSWDPDPAQRRTHAGLRFPIAQFDTFLAQCVPRWGCNDALTQHAYDALIQRMDSGAVVLAHSQGGNFGMTAALHAPDKVRAVVCLEPSGAPDPAVQDPRLLAQVPHLFVWGDYLDRHAVWARFLLAVTRWRDALIAAGGDVTWLELPTVGIRGTSHALMADDNSDEIAALVLGWLRERGLV